MRSALRGWCQFHAGAVVVGAALLLALVSCEAPDTRFASPAATYRTYQQAVRQGDFELLWSCYSDSYRHSLQGRRHDWLRDWQRKDGAARQAEASREIAEERVINGRIGYLLFDQTTLLSEHDSPFFYLMRDEAGWKITSHLDPSFQEELERAISLGDLRLPDS